MKKYRIKVNGKLYEVELEAVTETNESIQAPVKETKVEETKPAASTSAGGQNILAPIGGKIIDFQVKVGDTVKKGQTVAIIEAMKLENEVASEFEGTVKEIKVAKGAIVQNQEVIIVLG